MLNLTVIGLRGFPNIQGGIETHCENLYEQIAQRDGVQITVVCRSRYSDKSLRQWNGIKFKHLWSPTISGVEAFIHTCFAVICARLCGTDILHIHGIGPAFWTPLAKLLGMTVVVTHHGEDYNREKWGYIARFILKTGEYFAVKYADRLIVISQVLSRKFVDHSYKVAVIPNGVPRPSLSGDDSFLRKHGLHDKQYVLTVARLVPEKRQLDLIESYLGCSASSRDDCRLVLVGGDDFRSQYSNTVKEMCSQNENISYLGVVTGDDLASIYRYAKLFVLPSSHEGLPIALLEAVSYAINIAASDIEPNLEVGLPEQCYFPLGDKTALGTTIEKAVSREPGCDHRDVYSQILEKYSWSKIAQDTVNLYTELNTSDAGQKCTSDRE